MSQILYGTYFYFKKLLVYLKLKFNWTSCILTGNLSLEDSPHSHLPTSLGPGIPWQG